MAELNNLRIWLWDNGPEGLNTTVVTNYNSPAVKRSFFSFAGANTAQGFKAYRDKQPEALKGYFEVCRPKLDASRRWALDNGFEVRISKLVENTGTGGRRVLRGCMALMIKPGQYTFHAFIGEHEHIGEFSPDLLSSKQRNALGAYYWSKATEADNDWGEAF